MTRVRVTMLAALFVTVSALGQSVGTPELCNDVVTTLYPEWHSKIPAGI